MTFFILGALLLAAIAIFFVVLPLLRRPASADFSRQQLNAAIYRDQFTELERDRSEGALSQADYEQASAELQRRLLEDVATDETRDNDGTATAAGAESSTPPGRSLPLALAVLLPVAAVLTYLLIGNPDAIDPPHQQRFSQDDVEKMVTGLAAKLEQEPDNHKGWAMLARSYKMMGRFPDAIKAYGRVGTLLDESPDLLVDYADTLAAVNGFDPKVQELLNRALKIDPANMQGLWLRGSAAYETKQYAKAIADWEVLLQAMPADAEEARVIESNIAEARALLAATTGTGKGPAAAVTPAIPAPATPPATPPNSAAGAITGQVDVSPALKGQLPKNAQLMVIARPNDGSRMPVAVLRVPASALPQTFTLDDQQALQAERKPSQFSELLVEARISLTGQAILQSGDLFGPTQVIRPGSHNIQLQVDQIKP